MHNAKPYLTPSHTPRPDDVKTPYSVPTQRKTSNFFPSQPNTGTSTPRITKDFKFSGVDFFQDLAFPPPSHLSDQTAFGSILLNSMESHVAKDGHNRGHSLKDIELNFPDYDLSSLALPLKTTRNSIWNDESPESLNPGSLRTTLASTEMNSSLSLPYSMGLTTDTSSSSDGTTPIKDMTSFPSNKRPFNLQNNWPAQSSGPYERSTSTPINYDRFHGIPQTPFTLRKFSMGARPYSDKYSVHCADSDHSSYFPVNVRLPEDIRCLEKDSFVESLVGLDTSKSKYSENYCSTFYKRNAHGYMFIKEPSSSLKVNSRGSKSWVHIVVDFPVEDLPRKLKIDVNQLPVWKPGNSPASKKSTTKRAKKSSKYRSSEKHQ